MVHFIGGLGLLIFGGLGLLAVISWVIAYLTDPRFREQERRRKAEIEKRFREMRKGGGI
jgi:hypothetical protein